MPKREEAEGPPRLLAARGLGRMVGGLGLGAAVLLMAAARFGIDWLQLRQIDGH